MAIGTSWSSICFFQHFLPSSFLPQKRFFISGFLGGLWAFIDRKKGRGRFLYAARLSIESGWNVAVKRRLVKPIRYHPFQGRFDCRGGDVLLFAFSLGILMGVFERAPESVTGGTVRKTLSWISGRGYLDPVPGADDLRSGTSTNTTSTSTSSESDGSAQGSMLLESIEIASDEEIGQGIRVLDEEFVKSPVAI
jgi:hypothetical protein